MEVEVLATDPVELAEVEVEKSSVGRRAAFGSALGIAGFCFAITMQAWSLMIEAEFSTCVYLAIGTGLLALLVRAVAPASSRYGVALAAIFAPMVGVFVASTFTVVALFVPAAVVVEGIQLVFASAFVVYSAGFFPSRGWSARLQAAVSIEIGVGIFYLVHGLLGGGWGIPFVQTIVGVESVLDRALAILFLLLVVPSGAYTVVKEVRSFSRRQADVENVGVAGILLTTGLLAFGGSLILALGGGDDSDSACCER